MKNFVFEMYLFIYLMKHWTAEDEVRGRIFNVRLNIRFCFCLFVFLRPAAFNCCPFLLFFFSFFFPGPYGRKLSIKIYFDGESLDSRFLKQTMKKKTIYYIETIFMAFSRLRMTYFRNLIKKNV